MLRLTLCQHQWRRLATGEYECRFCGLITDERED